MRENDEAAGIRLHHLVNHVLQLVSPHAGEDNDGADVGVVHDFDDALGVHVLVNAGSVVDVVVDVNNVELCFVNFVDGRVEHGHGMEIFEQQRLVGVGVGGGLIADLGLLLGGAENCEREDSNGEFQHGMALVANDCEKLRFISYRI